MKSTRLASISVVFTCDDETERKNLMVDLTSLALDIKMDRFTGENGEAILKVVALAESVSVTAASLYRSAAEKLYVWLNEMGIDIGPITPAEVDYYQATRNTRLEG